MSSDSDGREPDAATTAAEMFAVMQSTRRRTQSRLVRSYTWLLVVWAIAWAVGFTALWLSRGFGGVPLLPGAVGATVFGVSLGAAVVWSIVTGVRSAGSGIRGRSQMQGALYGWSWTIAMVGASLLTAGLERAGLSEELAALLYPGIFILMVGVLYLAGGALWRSYAQYALGIVMIVLAVVATFVGAPYHYLVYATAGPAAMLIGAILLARGILPAEPRPRPASAHDEGAP